MVTASEIAKYLLYLNREEAERDGEEAASDLTPMKLQKLLYYCQGYSLGLTGRPLFRDTIEAWSYGPVVRNVYKEYRNYRGGCIPLALAQDDAPAIDDYAAGIVRLVMRDKGKYSASALVEMTHREPAWKEAWQKGMEHDCASSPLLDAPLSCETMKNYFSEILSEEMPPEEEDKLWKSAGREPTREEWQEIALSL